MKLSSGSQLALISPSNEYAQLWRGLKNPFCDYFCYRLNFLIVFFFACNPGTHSGGSGVDSYRVCSEWKEVTRRVFKCEDKQ